MSVNPPTPPSSGYDWARLAAIGASVSAVLGVAGKALLMLRASMARKRLAEIDARLEASLTSLLDKALQPVRESQQQLMLGAAQDRETQQERHIENVQRFTKLETQVEELKERRRYPRQEQ